MSEKVQSADLILKLYDLRREEKMRNARSWMTPFFPESAMDIIQAMVNPETSDKFRMVATYWDMAASFVNHGAIDEEMFDDAVGEHLIVFAKVQPYLAEVRQLMGNPKFLANLEKLAMNRPAAAEQLAARREMMKRWMEARAELAKGGGE